MINIKKEGQEPDGEAVNVLNFECTEREGRLVFEIRVSGHMTKEAFSEKMLLSDSRIKDRIRDKGWLDEDGVLTDSLTLNTECVPDADDTSTFIVSVGLAEGSRPNDEWTPEETEAMLKQVLADHPEAAIPQEGRRNCEKDVESFLASIEEFKGQHSLEALNAIVTAEEAFDSPIRKAAKGDLIKVVAGLKKLAEETDITAERHEELAAMYQELSDAVGIINRNPETGEMTVVHNPKDRPQTFSN